MTFPTRDQFLSTFLRRQNFNLPDSIIYYILKNPSSVKVYEKLIQCCKYFFIKNPILVFHCVHVDDEGWRICKGDCNFPKKLTITEQKALSGCKLWIQKVLRISSTNPKYASDLIFNIYQCDVKFLDLSEQKISLQNFLFYSQHVDFIHLETITISSEVYSEMPVEEIVANLPNIKGFFFKYGRDSKNVSSNTAKNLLQIPHFKNINHFSLINISEEFDIDTFYKYYKNHNTKFCFYILYQNLPSEDYAEKLDGIINDILDIGLTDRLTSMITYPGQDFMKRFTLLKLFEKNCDNLDCIFV